MHHQLVSIITPTYNHERFIGICIESVLAQSYSNWEMIIIDDGSTDKTADIVTKFDDARIRYFRQNHQGIWKLGETYNKALGISEGELIAVLEGDDLWPPYKLEEQIVAFENPDIVLSWGKAYVINEEGEITGLMPRKYSPNIAETVMLGSKPRSAILKRLLFDNFIPAVTVMIRRTSLLSIGGFQQVSGVPTTDYPTWLNLALLGGFEFVNDKIMGYWRSHITQATASTIVQRINAMNGYILDFYKSQVEPLFTRGFYISKADLESNMRDRLAYGYFYAGRVNLMRGRHQEARRYFYYAYVQGSMAMKCKSVLALICSFLGIDFEVIVTIFLGNSLR